MAAMLAALLRVGLLKFSLQSAAFCNEFLGRNCNAQAAAAVDGLQGFTWFIHWKWRMWCNFVLTLLLEQREPK